MSDKQLLETLASYVPKLIRRKVSKDPSPIEEPFSDRIEAAIFFADISGFTELTERLANQGPAGAELLADLLNEYFGQLIALITSYGGDVVKFAGDALIAVWPVGISGNSLEEVTNLAVSCSAEVSKKLNNYPANQTTLFLKVMISAGDITQIHTGGVFGRWEFLLAGKPIIEAGMANDLASAGEIIITPLAKQFVERNVLGEPVSFQALSGAKGLKVQDVTNPRQPIQQDNTLPLPPEAENSLKAYIPGAIIDRLAAGQTGWLAELRRVAVLFINLPDLSEDTELNEAQDIAHMLQTSLYRYEGSINKLNVDDKGITLIAALGLPPYAHEDDPVRAVNAALLIRKNLKAMNIRSYIGITSGQVFCGSVGSPERREYTIMGDVVNTSARLMGVAAQQTELIQEFDIPIVVDEATYEASRDEISFQELPEQTLKGKAEKIRAFHAVNERRDIVKEQMDLVGRDKERASIANALQFLLRGHENGGLIFYGEAGIGKTRLVEEAIRQAKSLNVHIIQGESFSHERFTPLHVWRNVFYDLFGMSLESVSNAAQTAEWIKDNLEIVNEELAVFTPLLDVFLPFDIQDNQTTAGMTGEMRANTITKIMVELLKNKAKTAPILITLEDAQWFDSGSWSLLKSIFDQVTPLLIIISSRPISKPWSSEYEHFLQDSNTKTINLEGLAREDLITLVSQQLGASTIPDEIANLIEARTEGHPFYGQELAFALRDNKLISINNGICTITTSAGNLKNVSLPDTLQGIITNRIDQLTPTQQLTLKVASVIGRVFAYNILQDTYPIKEEASNLSENMDALTNLSLTEIESIQPELTYLFKHMMTQEVVYNLMLFSQRRQLHQSVAEWYESNYQNDLSPYFPLLAYHWQQAVNTQEDQIKLLHKAIEFNEKAGEQSLDRYANEEAIQFFQNCLSLHDQLPKTAKDQFKTAKWHARLSQAHFDTGNLAEANENMETALSLMGSPVPQNAATQILSILKELITQSVYRLIPGTVERARNKSSLGDAQKEFARNYALLGRILFFGNETLPTLYAVFRFINSADRVGLSPHLAEAYAQMGVAASFVPAYTIAEYYAQHSIEVAKRLNNPATTANIALVNSVYKCAIGDWDFAKTNLLEAVEITTQLGDYRLWGEIASTLALVLWITGDTSGSLHYATQLRENSHQRNNELHEAWGLEWEAINWLHNARAEDAAKALEHSLELVSHGDDKTAEIEIYGLLADAYCNIGDYQKAELAADAATERITKTDPSLYTLYLGYSGAAQAYLYQWEDRVDSGETADPELIAKAKQACKNLASFSRIFKIGEPDMHRNQGLYEWLSNKPDKAMAEWAKSLEKATKYGMVHKQAKAHYEIGRRIESTNPTRTQHLQQAIDLFKSINASYDIARSEQALNGSK